MNREKQTTISASSEPVDRDKDRQRHGDDETSANRTRSFELELSADQADHHIDPDCERLLRTTKKQVKRLMEEAVTRKFIHDDSGCLISLCVGVDSCLSHGLKRRVLGLFKTSSSMALVYKMAKSCPAAQQIVQSIEKYKRELITSDQQQLNTTKNNRNQNSNSHQRQQKQQSQIRRYLWIKFALQDGKLVEIVEYLSKNANKYYESGALMTDCSCAQILCSLLVGPSSLEFSRNKFNESIQFQEDPTAYDLIKRHKLANPIACLCKQYSNPHYHQRQIQQKQTQQPEQYKQNNCDDSNNNHFEHRKQETTPIYNQHQGSGNNQQQSLTPKSSMKQLSSAINRRRPLSIKTNARRPTLMTDCHHYSCQEIAEHQQLRGYSMLTTLRGPLSAPGRGSFIGQANQINNTNTHHNNKTIPNQVSTSSRGTNQLDNSWSLWSPRMLHEIMHQNSKFRLLYGKNNILLENETNSFVPGYLSLHETDEDLILKWIPNQMINGSHINMQKNGSDDSRTEAANDESNNEENTSSNQKSHDNHKTVSGQDAWESIKDPTPIESSYLDLVLSIPISSIVLLHCHFRSSSIEIFDEEINSSNDIEQNRATSTGATNDCPVTPPTTPDTVESTEETLILVEADGIQRAPFRFPKGGLRLFLSCFETGLIPKKRYLDPAISLDQTSQWPQHPLIGSFKNRDGSCSGRSTPLGHSCSLGHQSSTSSADQASMNSSNKDIDDGEPCLGRLDSILRRFPSLKRRVRTKESDPYEGNPTTKTFPSSPMVNKLSNTYNNNQSNQHSHRFAPTNNYIYRIVNMNQRSDWSLPSVANGDSIGEISPICKSAGATTCDRKSVNGRDLAGAFRWNLRRWTNFTNANNSSSSSSLGQTLLSEHSKSNSTPTNNKQLSSDLTLDQVTMASELEDSPPDGVSPSRNNKNSDHNKTPLESFCSSEDGDMILDHDDNNSIKLARVQAKLSDLKKSTSDEVLETFRTQSIEMLCKSMRKQIMARAFYGWLVHCRRSKMIRKHLTHLIHPQANSSMDRKQRMEPNSRSSPSSDRANYLPFADAERFASGLTQTIWKSLISAHEEANDNDSDELHDVCGENNKDDQQGRRRQRRAELTAQLVSSYVYFGGIECNELRREVWPYLLKLYSFSDTTEDRRSQDSKDREGYEECGREWMVIEREVVSRDQEILAANIARARLESVSNNNKQQGNENINGQDQHHCVGLDQTNSASSWLDSELNKSPNDNNSNRNVIAEVTVDNKELDQTRQRAYHAEIMAKLEGSSQHATASSQSLGTCAPNEDKAAIPVSSSENALACQRYNESTRKSEEPQEIGFHEQAGEKIPRNTDDTNARQTRDGENLSELNKDSTNSTTLESSSEISCVKSDKHGETKADVEADNADGDDKNKSAKQLEAAPSTKRWRLESTGSVGSDAPITDQFGNNIHRIDKDVQRCDRNFWYFKDKHNLDKLRNIMCTYVWQNLQVGYVQGMCDLAAPFLVIFDGNEVKSFRCFNQLMKRMVNNFPLGSAMDQHFDALRYLIQVMDPKLFQVLQCNNEDNSCFYFCYRWLLLDFKRELTYADVYLVWETIWAARMVATDHFVVFLALAMVRYYRDIIIENNMDYTDTLKFFNEMAERHDIRRILGLARESVVELYCMMMI